VPATKAAKRTLVFIPGWNESYIKYKELLYDVAKKMPDCDIYMMDHISQGLSERWSKFQTRGWTKDFQHYVLDAEYFIKSIVLKGKPKGRELLTFAHSMGGLVTTHVTIKNPGLIDKLVLSAPMLDVQGLAGVPMPALRFVAWLHANVLGKAFEFLPGGGDMKSHRVPDAPENETSSCQDRLDTWNHTRRTNKQVHVGGVTWGWLNTSEYNRIDHDTLTAEYCTALNKTRIQLMCASEETICNNDAMKTFAGGVASCDLVMVPGSKHEAFMEFDPIRDFFITEICDFWNDKKKGKNETTWTAKPVMVKRAITYSVLLLAFLIWYWFTMKFLTAVGIL
jgi:lysophospholipase